MTKTSTKWTPAFGLAFALATTGAACAQTVAERIQTCGACHGEDGNSKIERIPSLAGQPETFLLNSLVFIREGVRQIPAMQEAVKGLKDADIQAIAKHFAALPARASDEKIDPDLARKGAELAPGLQCGSCHKPDLTGQQHQPRLARQRLDYLVYALKGFRDGTRSGPDPLMVNAILGRSDAEIEALAHFAVSR